MVLAKVASKIVKAMVTVDLDGETQKTFTDDTKDCTLNMSTGEIDVSPMDSDWKQFLAGQTEWDVSLNLFYDPTSTTAQEAIKAAMFQKAPLEVVLHPAGTGTGLPVLTGTGYVSSWSISASKEDSVGVSLSIRGTGPLVPTNQA